MCLFADNRHVIMDIMARLRQGSTTTDEPEMGELRHMSMQNVLTLLGGLALFLFGMNLMGDALERRAGSRLKTISR